MAYADFKNLNRRTFANKTLCDNAFYLAKYPKYDGYQRGLVPMVYKFFDKTKPLIVALRMKIFLIKN